MEMWKGIEGYLGYEGLKKEQFKQTILNLFK